MKNRIFASGLLLQMFWDMLLSKFILPPVFFQICLLDSCFTFTHLQIFQNYTLTEKYYTF